MAEKSPVAELFRQVENGKVLLFVSNEILSEICDVLTHPRVLVKYHYLTVEYVEKFLNRVLKKAVLLKKIRNHFQLPRDPKDGKYINLAVEAEADYIATLDKDLLDLMPGIDFESKEFRQRFRSLRIIEPVEFLKIIREKNLLLEP